MNRKKNYCSSLPGPYAAEGEASGSAQNGKQPERTDVWRWMMDGSSEKRLTKQTPHCIGHFFPCVQLKPLSSNKSGVEWRKTNRIMCCTSLFFFSSSPPLVFFFFFKLSSSCFRGCKLRTIENTWHVRENQFDYSGTSRTVKVGLAEQPYAACQIPVLLHKHFLTRTRAIIPGEIWLMSCFLWISTGLNLQLNVESKTCRWQQSEVALLSATAASCQHQGRLIDVYVQMSGWRIRI